MRPLAAPWRRFALAGIAAVGLSAVLTGALAAHPLGNFTINHYAGLRVSPTSIGVDFIVDMAEIPTFQERLRIDLNGDGVVDASEIETERLAACPRYASEVTLTAAGVPLELRATAAGLSFPLGQSGLETMRLVCEFMASPPAPITSPTTVTFEDRTWSLRIGWREITAIGDRVTIADGGVPTTSTSERLTEYPQDLLASPLAALSATIEVTPGGPPAVPFVAPDAVPLPGVVSQPTASGQPMPTGPTGTPGATPSSAGASAAPSGLASAAPSGLASAGALPAPSGLALASPVPSAVASPAIPAGAIPGGVTDEISRILEVRELTPVAILGSLLVAAFLGALHAVSPGHGKTVMAAYLVGSRGSARHAIALGLTVTVSHTLGVLGLAMVTLFAASVIPPERLYPILGLMSGALVVGIGVWLLVGRYRIWTRTRGGARDHEHQHGHDRGPWQEDATTQGRERPPAQARGSHTGAMALRRYGGDGAAMALARGQQLAIATPGVQGDADGVAPDHRAHGSQDHAPDQRAVPGEHSHGGVRHSHLPPSGTDLTWRSLFSLGLAGGLVPSASALLLLLGSLAANRPAYGVILVIAFGAGMAVVLAGVGLLLVYATRFLERIPTGTTGRRLWDVLPVATAVIVIGAGLYLTSQAFTQIF